MQALLNLTIVIVVLYILYKFIGGYLVPTLSERKLQRYKEQFLKDNPQIDGNKIEQRQKEAAERSSIIDHRPRKKKLF